MANVNHRGKRQPQRQYAQVLIPVEPVQQDNSHNGEFCFFVFAFASACARYRLDANW